MRVDNHILPTLFSTIQDALKHSALFIRAFYADAALYVELARLVGFLGVDPNDARREHRFATDFVFLGADSARVEVHMKVLSEENNKPSQHCLPQQILDTIPIEQR